MRFSLIIKFIETLRLNLRLKTVIKQKKIMKTDKKSKGYYGPYYLIIKHKTNKIWENS